MTRNGETLYASDFGGGTAGWRMLSGDWMTDGGVLRQLSLQENVRALVDGPGWAHYTLSVQARKLGGDEGFLVLFHVGDDNGKSWWNLGGWGNREHGVEMGGIVASKPGSIETGRWYDIRIEVEGDRIRCFLDGELIHDVQAPRLHALYASATRDQARAETILKVVNASSGPLSTEVRLEGGRRIGDTARAIVLTSGRPTDENSLEEPRKVSPVEKSLRMQGPVLRHEFPGNSLTILRIPTQP